MRVDPLVSIGTIASESAAARAVFESLGIDYCCAGSLTLEDAAHAAGLDPEAVTASLRRLPARDTASWNDRSLAELIDHLTVAHHDFVRDELSAISPRIAELCTGDEQTSTDWLSLRSAFAALSKILIPHIHDEEHNVFGTIGALEDAWQSAGNTTQIDGAFREQLQHIVEEHGTIAAQLRTIRQLRLRLLEANDISLRCRPILDAIASLEAHLHEYMFLENSVLLPRAIAIQEQIEAARTV